MKHTLAILLLSASVVFGQPTLTNSDDITAAKARANHTGTQGVETITGLGTAATAASGDFADDGAVFYAARYGVLADGTTNDTVALQAAIDAASAAATATTRSTVMLPAGMIRLTKTVQTGVGEDKQAINLRPNVNIIGQGIGSTVVKLLDAAPYDCPVFLAYSMARSNSTTTNASATVAVSSTVGLHVGMPVTGSGIPSSTEIRAIVNGTTLTLSANATATSSAVTLTFFPANIAVKNLTIDGNALVRFSGGAGGEDEGLNFKGGANILVSQVRITNCGQDGIDTDAGTDITVSNCVLDRNAGNGIHAVGGGPKRFKVIGCHFLSNGFQRRGNDGLAGSGSGIDTLATELIIDGCTFLNNVVEIQALAGHVTITNTQILHGGASVTDPALTTTLSAVVAGNTTGGAATDASMTISGCRMVSSVASTIEVVNSFPLVQILGNRVNGSTTVTSGGRIIFNDNYQTGVYGVHLVSTNKPATICGNYFEPGYSNGLRIEASTGGLAQGNQFLATSAVSDIQLRAGSTGWSIIGNKFPSASSGIVSVSGGGISTRIYGNTGGFDLSLGAGSSVVKGNDLDAVTWAGNGATGNLFEENTITSITNSGTVTFASNTWRRNTGAGCLNVFYGTATLTSGTSGTINTAAANSARKFGFSRQAPNSSTAIGNLALGTITANASFVINALNDTATVATGDLSSVYWEILE